MTKNLKGFVEILIVVLLAVVGIWIVGSFIVGPSFVIPTPTTESTPNSNENHLSPKDWWFDQNQPLTEYNQQRYDQFTDIIINELKGIKIMPDARPEGIALTEVYLVNNQWIYQISMSIT